MAGVVIIGAGPGIGLAVARRFAADGLPVALVARSERALAGMAAELSPAGVPVAFWAADCADEAASRTALDGARARFGVPEVLVYNAAVIRPDLPGELSVREHQETWAVNVGGAVTAAAHVLPMMAERGGGTFVVTGGMPEPKAAYTSLSLGKAAVRALVTLLDERFGPAGVHVATVTVAGVVAAGTERDPAIIAEHCRRLHSQPRGAWQREAVV